MKTRHVSVQMGVAILTAFFCNVFALDEGKVTVTTDPEGVEVWLGDNYIGNSPVIEKKVPTGKYIIKLVDPVQRTSQIEQILVTPNNTVTIEKKMKPRFGTLKVNSVPEDADVYITMPLGKTPLLNEFINPGKYEIEIQHPNKRYHSLVKSVVVSEGSANLVSDTLVKDKLLNNKALLRLALGAGALGSFIWGAVENGKQHSFKAEHKDSDAKTAGVLRTIGLSAGALCVVGFEVVAFF